MIIRIRFKLDGGHVHCRLFTAVDHNYTFAKCGDLVFSVDEWPEVCSKLGKGAEIVPEDV